MRNHEIIEYLETKFNALDSYNDEQHAIFVELIEQLSISLSDNYPEVSERQLVTLFSELRQRITYYQDPKYQDCEDYTDVIRAMCLTLDVTEEKNACLDIPGNSLFLALIYLNDIIAGSSAMGRGTEDSIVQDKSHNEAVKDFFDELSPEFICTVTRCRNQGRHQGEYLVHTIFDIAEMSYARLADWRDDKRLRKKKIDNIDMFYERRAENCMAKGSMYLLRELLNLPHEVMDDLATHALSLPVMDKLKKCSEESLKIIHEELKVRRYRGGNSASTWLGLRSTIQIGSFSERHLVAELPRSVTPEPIEMHLEYDYKTPERKKPEKTAVESSPYSIINVFSPAQPCKTVNQDPGALMKRLSRFQTDETRSETDDNPTIGPVTTSYGSVL